MSIMTYIYVVCVLLIQSKASEVMLGEDDVVGTDDAAQDPSVLSCLADLENNKVITGAQKYLNLHSRAKMAAVLKIAYDKVQLDKILLFTEELPTISLRAQALRALTQAIASKGSPDTLKVQLYLTNKYGSLNLDEKSRQMFDYIQDKLTIAESIVVNKWVKNVKDPPADSYKDIVDFANDNVGIFKKYLEKIVTLAYDSEDEDSTLRILEYNNALPKIEQSAVTIIALHREISNRLTQKCAMRMAKEIDILQKMKNYGNIPDYQKKGLGEIMNGFPDAVKGIAKGDALCIRNTNSFGLLYVQQHHDGDRDSVSTAQTPHNDISKKWKFEEERDWYLIKSDLNDDYLYAAGDNYAYDESKRRLFTWRPSTGVLQGRWQLQEVDWRNNEYYLYNTHHQEYLTTEDSETFKPAGIFSLFDDLLNKRDPSSPAIFERRAFTWRKDGKGKHPVWKIYYC